MRASRSPGWRAVAGMDTLDPSPVWPDGAGLMISRPFLGQRREQLRAGLHRLGASWTEDPSNDDPAYERVRWRRAPLPEGGARERALLAFSTAAQKTKAAMDQAAFSLISESVSWTPWGGAVLDRNRFAAAPRAVALRAIEPLILAASGQAHAPGPDTVCAFLNALLTSNPVTGAGAMLTRSGVLGRDPGAAAGRADGAPGAGRLHLRAGETGVYDGRWRISARQDMVIEALGADGGGKTGTLKHVPAPLRPGLAAVRAVPDGRFLALAGLDSAAAGIETQLLARTRLQRLLLPLKPPSWFDGERTVARAWAALAERG